MPVQQETALSMQDLQAEISLLANDLRAATDRLRRIQAVIGTAGPAAGPATEGVHRIPEIVGQVPESLVQDEATATRRSFASVLPGDSPNGPTGATLPEARATYVTTVNEAGYCAGDRVLINWDRVRFRGRPTRREGQMATVTRATSKKVWIVEDAHPNEAASLKTNHNVTLITPAVGAEEVMIKVKGREQRLVRRSRR
jgi:hypothetical protein